MALSYLVEIYEQENPAAQDRPVHSVPIDLAFLCDDEKQRVFIAALGRAVVVWPRATVAFSYPERRHLTHHPVLQDAPCKKKASERFHLTPDESGDDRLDALSRIIAFYENMRLRAHEDVFSRELQPVPY